MSPVSRGRKAKKSAKRRRGASATRRRTSTPVSSPGLGLPAASPDTGRLAVPAGRGSAASPLAALAQQLLGTRERPGWFDAATTAVLDQDGPVLAARTPRELEDVTAGLLGGEMYRVLHSEQQGMWFEWFEELAKAAASRACGGLARRDQEWQAPWRLLHGMAAIGSPALRQVAQTAIGRVQAVLPAYLAREQPGWLGLVPRVTATGEAWHLADVYGTRFAVIAGFCYPGRTHPSVFLFDIDACGPIELVGGGCFDTAEQAADAWRGVVGDLAGAAGPHAVAAPGDLLPLVYCDVGEEFLKGHESPAVMDNWFRARRRIFDVAEALDRKGTPLPEARSLYKDIETEPVASEFAQWHVLRHGTEPDEEVVGALAEEWLAAGPPGHRRGAGHAAGVGALARRAGGAARGAGRPGGRRRREPEPGRGRLPRGHRRPRPLCPGGWVTWMTVLPTAR